MGVVFLLLVAIGIWLVPDLRGNPWAIGASLLIFLGAAGLVYGKWLEIRSQQAMIDLERRKR